MYDSNFKKLSKEPFKQEWQDYILKVKVVKYMLTID